jgi:hypothetical protein
VLLTAELLVFVIGPRECLDRVHGSQRPSVAQRRSFTNEFHLLLSPTWHHEIGRVWILHRRICTDHTISTDRQTPQPQPSQMTAYVCFCHVHSKSIARILCLAASKRACVRELYCLAALAPDGRSALRLLIVSEE